MEKFYHSMNILDLPATIQLGKIWRRQSTTEMLKRKENSSVPVFKQDLQNPEVLYGYKKLYSKHND